MSGGVLNFYGDRMEELLVDSKQSIRALVLRKGKSVRPATINDEKKILIDIQNNIQCGDIVTRGNGIKYFIVAKQSSDECSDLIANRINTYIQVIRLEKQYEDYEVIGTKKMIIEENVPTYFKDVSASMRFYDAGLLKDTVKTILIKNTVDIKELDRVKLNDVNYQVDSIDEGRYENMYYIQLSEDTRKVIDE